MVFRWLLSNEDDDIVIIKVNERSGGGSSSSSSVCAWYFSKEMEASLCVIIASRTHSFPFCVCVRSKLSSATHFPRFIIPCVFVNQYVAVIL